MRKHEILPYVLLILFIVIILASILIFIDHPGSQGPVIVDGKTVQINELNYLDGHGLTGDRRIDLIRTALMESHIKELAAGENTTIHVGDAYDNVGWHNPYSHTDFVPVIIPIYITHDDAIPDSSEQAISGIYEISVIVDRQSGRVYSVDIGDHRNEPVRSYAIIPAGGS